MKLLRLLIVFSVIGFLLPWKTQALTCAERDGNCGPIRNCLYGDEIDKATIDDCQGTFQKCCPKSWAGESCGSVGGTCNALTVPCLFGPAIPNRCPTNLLKCCPPQNDIRFGCDGDEAINTAIGCIPYDITGFSQTMLRWGLGLAGGIVTIVIIVGAAMISMAGGDPKKVQAGKEMVVAAIGGLLLIIFSILILNFIGVRVLNLQGLGFQI